MSQSKNACIGITPACAGSTPDGLHVGRQYRDHPRVCGEYFLTLGIRTAILGSPPRVRGVRNLLPEEPSALGITPACAGSTLKSLIEPDAKMI